MSFGVISYRVFRLRRLIVVSMLLPVLVVLLIAAFKGPAAFVLLAIAIGVPLFHVLRYPNSWMETLVVSLTLSIMLALGGTIGPDVGLPGLALRLVGWFLGGLVLFMALNLVLPSLIFAGPAAPLLCRAKARSRLSPEALKAAITIYPGRSDAKTVCGAADEDGVFPVTITHMMDDPCNGTTEVQVELYAQVLASTPESHEVMSIEPQLDADDPEMADLPDEVREAVEAALEGAEPDISLTRHQFTATSRGCVVELAERGVSLTRGQALGFWLQDYMADHLTDEVDRAEGRPPRANRSADHNQFIVDIAKLFMPGKGLSQPED